MPWPTPGRRGEDDHAALGGGGHRVPDGHARPGPARHVEQVGHGGRHGRRCPGDAAVGRGEDDALADAGAVEHGGRGPDRRAGDGGAAGRRRGGAVGAGVQATALMAPVPTGTVWNVQVAPAVGGGGDAPDRVGRVDRVRGGGPAVLAVRARQGRGRRRGRRQRPPGYPRPGGADGRQRGHPAGDRAQRGARPPGRQATAVTSVVPVGTACDVQVVPAVGGGQDGPGPTPVPPICPTAVQVPWCWHRRCPRGSRRRAAVPGRSTSCRRSRVATMTGPEGTAAVASVDPTAQQRVGRDARHRPQGLHRRRAATPS